LAKAYVLLKCESGYEDYVLSNLRSLDSVTSATGVLGAYDVLATLDTDSEEKLRDVVTKQIRKIPKITGTYTLIADSKNSFGKTIDGKEILDMYLSQAHVLIDCDANGEAEVINRLREIPEVTNADVLVSSHQVMCNIMAPTYNDISDVVTKKIRRMPHIKGTTTLNMIGK
jgi:DNA-binding Lrp family transcriptional regulator